MSINGILVVTFTTNKKNFKSIKILKTKKVIDEIIDWKSQFDELKIKG
jgi:hypothetical protein